MQSENIRTEIFHTENIYKQKQSCLLHNKGKNPRSEERSHLFSNDLRFPGFAFKDKELVGDIWDETDTVETPVKEVNEGIYEVDGDETVSELLDLMGWDEDDFDFESETIGGWCIEMIGRFPEAGQSFTWRSAEFTVLEVDERRVLKVRIQKNVETGE
jgi:NhaP-type Na+/H+ and K+/H+ antiporter